MKEFRLTTIGALAGLGVEQLMVPFGNRCQALHALSHGVDDTVIARPSIESDIVEGEHTFANDTNSRSEIESVLASLIGRLGHTLRQQKKVTRRVGLWLRYSDGGEMVRQASHKSGTSSEFVLQSLALLALKRCWQRRTRIRSCRLACDRLLRQSPQLSLFSPPTSRGRGEKKVENAMDHIRTRFGSDSIGIGRQYGSS